MECFMYSWHEWLTSHVKHNLHANKWFKVYAVGDSVLLSAKIDVVQGGMLCSILNSGRSM